MKTKGYDSIVSWIAVFASAVIGFLVPIPMRLAGFFFVIIIDQYKVDREKATIPIVVFGMLRSLNGPFIGYFGQTIGLRATTILGCFLASLGIGLCFFADDIITVIICLGFIYGLGLGFGVSLIPEILKQHFANNINTPFGVYCTGSCFGAIVMPKVMQFLNNEYGNSGMLLILSAIVLNSIPAAMILKDPKNNTKHMNSELQESGIDDEKAQNTGALSEEKPIEFNDTLINERSSTVSINFSGNTMNTSKNCKTSYDNAGFDIKDEPPDIKKNTLLRESETTYNTNTKTKLANNSSVKKNGKKETEVTTNYSNSKVSSYSKSKNLQSLQVFMNPTFYLTMFVQSSHGFVTTLTWTIIVDLGRDRGISTELSLYFLMIFPIAEMIGGIGLNWITNSGYMSQTFYCVTCYLILGFVEICLVWVYDFTYMMICFLIFGVFSGSLGTTMPGMVYEFFDEDQISMALTSRFILYSALCLTKSPIIGYFRGTLGSYDWVLYLIAISCVSSAILVSFTPYVSSWSKKKSLKKCKLASKRYRTNKLLSIEY